MHVNRTGFIHWEVYRLELCIPPCFPIFLRCVGPVLRCLHFLRFVVFGNKQYLNNETQVIYEVGHYLMMLYITLGSDISAYVTSLGPVEHGFRC